MMFAQDVIFIGKEIIKQRYYGIELIDNGLTKLRIIDCIFGSSYIVAPSATASRNQL